MLVLGHLLEHLVNVCCLLVLRIHSEHRQRVVEVGLALGFNRSGQTVGGRVPLPLEGKYAEVGSSGKLHDEHDFIVHLRYLLMKLVAVSPIVLLKVGAKDVALRREESRERCVLLQAYLLTHFCRLDAYQRLFAPLLAEEDEAAKHLLGGVAVVGRLAVELAGEVEGKRLDGADAAIIVDAQTSELCSLFLGERVERMSLCGHQQHNGDSGACLADQLAEAPHWVDEHQYHGEKQESVSRIGDGYAPWVAVE